MAIPRHPAWTRATRSSAGPAIAAITQSAEKPASGRPFRLVCSPSAARNTSAGPRNPSAARPGPTWTIEVRWTRPGTAKASIPKAPATFRRFAATASGSSPTLYETFSDAKGSALAPPVHSTKAARNPAPSRVEETRA